MTRISVRIADSGLVYGPVLGGGRRDEYANKIDISDRTDLCTGIALHARATNNSELSDRNSHF
jgi:hypothetical protein